MRIAAVRMRPYRLPLRRPWMGARATMAIRLGTLVAIALDDGTSGWGDCAPLPSTGEAGYRQTHDELLELANNCVGLDLEGLRTIVDGVAHPEVGWALESAMLDALARRLGVSLYRYLGGAPCEAIAVNAALGPLDAECISRARRALEHGFAVAKIKVGIADRDAEIARLRDLADETDGQLGLRLDANRAWTSADAARFLGALADLPIDGIEEPLREPSIDALSRLQHELPYAIAVDESLRELGIDGLLDSKAVRRLVVKPARLGSVAGTLALADKAHANGIELVLTSVVDSAIGVTAAAHLAAALPVAACHGLATLEWLADDVATAPAIEAGMMQLGSAAGLGIAPFGEVP